MLLTKEEINKTMSELARYNIILKEAKTVTDELKKKLQIHMEEANVDKLIGDEHIAKLIHSQTSKIDAKLFKENFPDLVDEYTVTTLFDYVKLTT